jgi:hypothetical protein
MLFGSTLALTILGLFSDFIMKGRYYLILVIFGATCILWHIIEMILQFKFHNTSYAYLTVNNWFFGIYQMSMYVI